MEVDPESTVSGTLVQREVLGRLALGAAHAWNNALTAILGEVRCLLDACGDDERVVRACAEIDAEAQRCARLTHALQMRGEWRPGVPTELELGVLARGLAPLVRESVSRACDVSWDLPAAGAWVRGRREDVELLLLLAIQTLLRGAAGGTRLRIVVGKPVASRIDVRVELHPPDAPAPSAGARTPAWDDLVSESARVLAAGCGVEWLPDPAGRQLCLRFTLASP